jgi:hypothetical protein
MSEITEDELWSGYGVWELVHGEKIVLTQSHLISYGGDGWALFEHQ